MDKRRRLMEDAEDNEMSSLSDTSEDEGEEYVETTRKVGRQKSHSVLKRVRQALNDPRQDQPKSALFNLCNQGCQALTVEIICGLTETHLADLLFELSGFPSSLFDAAEIAEHDPAFLIESGLTRSDEMNYAVSPLSLVLIPLLRQLAKQRSTEIQSQRQKLEQWKACGLTNAVVTSESVGETGDAEYAATLETFRAMIRIAKFKVFDELRIGVMTLCDKMLTSSDDSVVLNERLPILVKWLKVMCVSSIRPIRHTGVFIASCVARSVMTRLAEMSSRVHMLVTQINTTQRIAELTRTIKNTLQAAIAFIEFLRTDVRSWLTVRHRDISWHVQLEILISVTDLCTQSPYYWAIGPEGLYQSIWLALVDHANPEMRVYSFHSLKSMLQALHKQLKRNDSFLDPHFDFWIQSPDPSFAIVQTAVQSELNEIESLRSPDIKMVINEIDSFLHTIFPHVLTHARDQDRRVAVAASDCIILLGTFETERVPGLALSDDLVTRTVALLFTVDSPLVQVQVAKFVDAIIFTHSIVNEADVMEILDLTNSSKLPPLTGNRVVAMSVELNTFIEFLRDYADTPSWQARHIQGVKAFWILSPFLHYWDFIIDHICVAFNQTALVSSATALRQSIDASWVRPESSESLLSLMLSLIEIERTALGGQSRYYVLPRFHTLHEKSTPETNFKQLSELSGVGFRAASRPELVDPLWDFKCPPPNTESVNTTHINRVKRMAERLSQIWRVAKYLLEGAQASAALYCTCLCIIYECLTASDSVVFTHALEYVEMEMDLTLLEAGVASVLDIIMTGTPRLQNRKALQASFAIMQRLYKFPSLAKLQEERYARASGPLLSYIQCRKGLKDKILDFLSTTRSNTLRQVQSCANQLSNAQDAESLVPLAATYRSSLLLLTALTENDVTNTFRDNVESLDEMISLIELKTDLMTLQVTEPKKVYLEPSDHLTSLTFEIVWLGLARWLEQIETRFIGYILPEIDKLVAGEMSAASPQDFASRLLRAQGETSPLEKLADRLKLLKQDLEVYKELMTQLLSFAAKYCEGLRGKLQRPVPQQVIDSLTIPVPANTPASTVLDLKKVIHRKSVFLAATLIVKLIINASFFHTLPRLWFSIEQYCKKAHDHLRLTPRSELTASIILICRDIQDLCRTCRDPPRSENAHEVAFFLDQLRQLAAPHRKMLKRSRLEPVFSLQDLSYSLLASFGSAAPSPAGPVSVGDLYRDCLTEEAVVELCHSLPSLPEMAFLTHIHLTASVCQIPDPGLWKDASVGAVILTGLSSVNVILQTLAKVFLNRMKDYDDTRKEEIVKIKNEMGVKVEEVFDDQTEPSMLCQILCGIIAELIDRAQRNPAQNNLDEVKVLATNAANHLYPHYFLDMSTEDYNKFVWHVVRLSWIEPACPQVEGVILEIISECLLRGKTLKRKWKLAEALNSLNQIKTNFEAYFGQLENRERFGSEYFDSLENFFGICYSVPKRFVGETNLRYLIESNDHAVMA
eukprot:Blabericola_migrator_1__1804@NODE_148_length_12903_cov_144_651293_g129_i0_p1_GENE_NODE_148_length_12903_cov_144_651293_g129_i0NODE_148_length_12903_cov_144_651293_g129_i0_p1_ORF_typecomplete_len1491_score322_15STAG/PF08514_11/3_1e06Vac14_Fab1_bd/PF12755_7/6_6e03Vac14_Fab1_bd/PF12755_7/0_87Vac14_Fab1_bd/PF12755_7/4_4e03Chordopox_A30L/PF06015_12/3_2Chordopox_A30L/PF06015_12/3e03Chordopox_A30L/PF06015_12/2_8e02Antiadapt_IraP/PF10796_9/8_9e02Antiadapt_IraP/PF10796_9/22Antiadapt_IraP/PF10796_9/3_3e02